MRPVLSLGYYFDGFSKERWNAACHNGRAISSVSSTVTTVQGTAEEGVKGRWNTACHNVRAIISVSSTVTTIQSTAENGVI